MPETAYPYATHLDVKFDPLKLIDVPTLVKAVRSSCFRTKALSCRKA
jgi:hypothetical protein